MPELAHLFGQDLQWGPAGDLALVSGPPQTQQRLLRRLLTNSGDYIWQLGYGAGLGKRVGEPANALRIQAVILSQVLLEAAVSPVPVPTVAVASDNAGTVTATISYTDADTGLVQVLNFTLPA